MAQTGRGWRSFSADCKARMAKDAMREAGTLKSVAAHHGVHLSQVKEWRRQLEENGRAGFLGGGAKRDADQAATIKELHAKIGELMMERDFFTRFRELIRAERLAAVRKDDPLGIARQCRPSGVRRMAVHRPARGTPAKDLALMRRIDELHTAHPAYGVRQMRGTLLLEGLRAGRNRVK